MAGDVLSIPQQENALVQRQAVSLLLDAARFEHAQRVAKMFAASTMVPDHFKNNIGNCVIALNLADRMSLDPFMVMQKMYIVHGKPGIESQLAIAVINSSGKFTPLQFKMTGEGNPRQCVAYAKRTKGNEVCEGPAVSMQMAKDEGWFDKKGSKWQTMPELMLRYRAAMFFGRLYCPEALLGLQTSDEIYDVIDVTPNENGSFAMLDDPGKPKATPDDFDDKAVDEGLDIDAVAAFLAETAETVESTIDNLKVEIMDDWGEFIDIFNKWLKRNGKGQKKDPKPAQEPDKPADLHAFFLEKLEDGDEAVMQAMASCEYSNLPTSKTALEKIWKAYND